MTGDKEGVANLKPNNGSNRPQLQDCSEEENLCNPNLKKVCND